MREYLTSSALFGHERTHFKQRTHLLLIFPFFIAPAGQTPPHMAATIAVFAALYLDGKAAS